jgi:hypothetical protein
MNTVLTSSFHIPCFFIYFFLRVYNSGKTSRDCIHLTGAGWSLLVRACAALRSYAFEFYSSFLHLFLRSSFFGLRSSGYPAAGGVRRRPSGRRVYNTARSPARPLINFYIEGELCAIENLN